MLFCYFIVQGITFRLIDTAGIRDTTDTIESIGIERTFQKIEQASIVLWITDAETPNKHLQELAKKILPATDNKQLILIFNKVDVISDKEKIDKAEILTDVIGKRLFISAKYQQGTNELENMIVEAANIPQISEQDIIVTNMRHYEALCNALNAIKRVSQGLDQNISGDFLAQDIRECMHYIGEITGQISSDEILGNIFSKFCIGK